MSSVFNQGDVIAGVAAGAIYAIFHSSPRLSREVPPHVAAVASLGFHVIQKGALAWVKLGSSHEPYWRYIRTWITNMAQWAALVSQTSVPKASLVWTLHVLVSQSVFCAHETMKRYRWAAF